MPSSLPVKPFDLATLKPLFPSEQKIEANGLKYIGRSF